ncbi:MAG: hypothetical protein IPP53_11065 [Bacteroidetes bacterium]|nr:hypothetical protein [Bacteroidota bacterium]
MNFKNINFKFLPIENYTFKSKLSSNELIKIIDEHIEPKKFSFRLKSIWGVADYKRYIGYINEYNFKISTWPSFSNRVIPVIYGEIVDEIDGSTITLKNRLSIIEIVTFSIFFFLFVIENIIYIAQLSSIENLIQKSWKSLSFFSFFILLFCSFSIETAKRKFHF